MAKSKQRQPDWETDPEAQEVRLYCIGRRRTATGKLMPFYTLDPANEDESFGITKLASGWPGAVVSVFMKDTSFWAGSSKFVETYDGPEVEGWKIEDRAAYGADQLRLAEQRAKRESTDLGTITLAGLREKMHTLPYNGQHALIAQVLLYLARP